MSDTRLKDFKMFLTEQFTTLAVEVFAQVQTLVEASFEENQRLRCMLRTVLGPEIKLPRIDFTQYTETTSCTREQLVEPNIRPNLEISEPMIIPKEEQTEYEITCSPERELWPVKMDDGDVPDCVKTDPEEQEANMSHITDSCNIQVVQCNQNSSATVSAYETNGENDDSSSWMSDEAQLSSSSLQSKDATSSSQKHQRNSETTNKNKPKLPRQKTLLQMPRMRVHKYFSLCPAEQESFMTKFCENFKDFPDDQKPLITKMDLKTKVEMVQCAFGEVAVGSPLSYQCPLPTNLDYMPYGNPPPLPPLPLLLHSLEPVSVLPTLNAKEQEYLNAMIVSWEEAHILEVSTRGSKSAAEKSLKMRLTSHFRKIAKLKSGRSHVEHLLFKIKKDNPRSKTLSCQVVDEELKPEALWEYCRHLCVNWSPCGLVVHPNAPWLGVMPDGVVYDHKEKHNYGVVYTKYVDVQSIVECNFLLCQDGVVQLKRAHRYYWQIQGQLMVMSMSWCDLLVYSRKNLLVQRIYRDESVIKSLKKKLEVFFFYFYLPNLD